MVTLLEDVGQNIALDLRDLLQRATAPHAAPLWAFKRTLKRQARFLPPGWRPGSCETSPPRRLSAYDEANAALARYRAAQALGAHRGGGRRCDGQIAISTPCGPITATSFSPPRATTARPGLPLELSIRVRPWARPMSSPGWLPTPTATWWWLGSEPIKSAIRMTGR